MLAYRAAKVAALTLFAVTAIAVAACGGGGSSSPAPASTATPSPSPMPTSGQATVTINSAQSSTATFGPIAGGDSGSITFPPGSNPATISLGFTTTEPLGLPLVQSVRRAPQTIGGQGLSVLAYVAVTPNTTVSFAATPSFTLTLPVPATNLGVFAYIAAFDPANADLGWQLGPGPAIGTQNTLSFTGLPAALTLTGGVTYDFAYITVAAPLLVGGRHSGG